MAGVTLGGSEHRVELIEVHDDPGPWLAFLHEGLGSIPQWRSFPSELAEACHMNALVYERRNHGGSDLLPGPRGHDYHMEEAELFERLLDVLGVDRVVSFGHSDGATIALLHAARYPGRVAAVISVAGHVVAEEVARDGIVETRRRFSDGPLREALRRHHGEKVDAMFAAWADTWLLPAMNDWSIVEDLAPVTAPLLVIQGADDEYATAAHVDWIADAVSGRAETWLLPGVGHAPHFEARDAVIDHVASFLAQTR